MHAITNNGKGRPVVLIHGNSLSSDTWITQLGAPELKSFRLIAVDLPGHGASPRNSPDDPYSMEGFASAVADFILDLDDVVIVGHSLGGHIAVRVPSKAPNVHALMLVGMTPLSGVSSMGVAFQPQPVLGKAFSADITEEDARSLALLCTWPGSVYVEAFTQMFLNTDPRVRAGLGAEIASGQLADEQMLIQTSGLPVCMAFGADDPLLSLSYLEKLAPLFWRERIHVFEGSGHSPQLQDSAEFNDLLINFIKSVLV